MESIERYLTRRAEIEGRPILVYDGLVSQTSVDRITSALERNAFTHTEASRADTIEFKHWVVKLTPEDVKSLPIYQPSLDAILPLCRDGLKYRLYRAYCNYASYGDMLFTHTDAPPDSKDLTALWFMAKQWHIDWGGETVFFDSNQDAVFVASPKPGRLVVFDGSILHVGRPPNRICFAPRFTFALKFEVY